MGSEMCIRDRTMHRAINNMKDKYITINQSNGITRLRYSEVYYVEGRGHNVIINLRDSEISIYMAFSKFLGLLDMDRCALTHKSFAVNMEYVREFGSRDVILTNGAAVPLSRSRKTEFKKNFLRYVTRR